MQGTEKMRGKNALERYLHIRGGGKSRNGFARIQACREALDALDRRGWQRSFHQRMFHENFIRACARVFFKTEPPGSFAKAHQTILDLNGWDNLSQEILISTPRRRGLSQRPPSCRPGLARRPQWRASTFPGRRRGGCRGRSCSWVAAPGGPGQAPWARTQGRRGRPGTARSSGPRSAWTAWAGTRGAGRLRGRACASWTRARCP